MGHSPKHFDEIASLFSASCPFGKLSVRENVRSAKCPFGKTSVRQNVCRQNVRSAKCLSAKCLSAKCLSANCPGTTKTIIDRYPDFGDVLKTLSKRAILVPIAGAGQGCIHLLVVRKNQNASHSVRYKKNCKITMVHVSAMGLLSSSVSAGTKGGYQVNGIKASQM